MINTSPSRFVPTRFFVVLAATALGAPLAAFGKDAPNQHDFPGLNGERKPVIIVMRHGEDLKNWIPASGDVGAWNDQVRTETTKWPTYVMPPGVTARGVPSGADLSTFKVNLHGLSPDGEAQAEFVRERLAGLVSALNGLPITRVITKRPDLRVNGVDPTPNPFDTVFPFIKGGGFKGEVLLVDPGTDPESNPLIDRGLAAMLPDFAAEPPKLDSLLPADGQGSTLICWDAEGLWGKRR